MLFHIQDCFEEKKGISDYFIFLHVITLTDVLSVPVECCCFVNPEQVPIFVCFQAKLMHLLLYHVDLDLFLSFYLKCFTFLTSCCLIPFSTLGNG